MTTIVISALGVAFGLIGAVLALRPQPLSLRMTIARLEGELGTGWGPEPGPRSSPWFRLDEVIAGQLAGTAWVRDDLQARLAPQLAITGTTFQVLLSEVVLFALVGSVLPAFWWLMVTAGGVRLPFSMPVWAGIVCGGTGAAIPVLILRSRASKARRIARHAVGSFLNLVVLCLAGGMGIESALHSSAEIGEDAVSERIVQALSLARDAGAPPWEALDRLGRELGVTELSELAAAVGLAGAEGARIRLTLSAKATSIRRHELAEAESAANTVTERLFLPGVFLLIGFLTFVAYPAVARISAGV